MKIYQLHFDNEHYDYFVPERDLPISELRTFDGRSKQNEWTPLAVRRANWRKGMELSDAPCCILPVFRREVLDALRPLIAGSVEELELVCLDGDYCGVNVTAVLDVIDYTKSKRIYCDEKQKIPVFERYRYEGFPSLYRKEIFEMEIGGKVRECIAYVMNRGEIAPPSQQYYQTILNGYRANGLEEHYLERALLQSMTEQEERIRQEELDEEEDFVMGLE